MAAPTDNKGLDLAPDAGSLASTTLFAVQQSTASGIIQSMPRSEMVVTGQITGQGFLDDKKAVTPAAFQATQATATAYGVCQLAEDSDIENKTGNDVLTAGKMDKIFEEGIQQTGTIEQADVDASTQGTVTIVGVRGSTFGKLFYLSGQFTYQSDVSEEKRSLYFNNINVPIQYTASAGQYERDDKVGLKLPMTFGFEAAGVDRVRMDINTNLEGVNWDTSRTYTIDFTITYLIP